MTRFNNQHSLLYYQGPLLAPANDDTLPDYETLATFETESARNGAVAGIMTVRQPSCARPSAKAACSVPAHIQN
ncbi:MAG: hypothetical protein EXS14_10180 [Planctomycetes bacterium]|nr:hypothetical protein [Planctomycetota bacterium]